MNESTVFNLIRDYFSRNDMANIQKESFDFFIHHRLQKIIDEEPFVECCIKNQEYFRIEFGQVYVDHPYILDENRIVRYIFPNEARIRELTYASPVLINIKTLWYKKCGDDREVLEEKTHNRICIAKIPMMIGTSKCNLFTKTPLQKQEQGECQYDNGGYFIVKGKERVLVAQERMNHNNVYVFQQHHAKYRYYSEIRSISEETGHSVLTQMKLQENDFKITMTLPYITQDISVGCVFRALGLSYEDLERLLRSSLREVYEDARVRPFLNAIYREFVCLEDDRQANLFLSQFTMHVLSREKKEQYIKQILTNELFPHLGICCSLEQKTIFMGHMMYKLFMVFLGRCVEDDRDHISNKRIETAGYLLSELFRTLYKRFIRSLEPIIAKRQDVMASIMRFNILTHGIKHCFSTGNWGLPKSNYVRTGVSQILSRLTYNSFLSHLRRIIIPIGKEGKNTKIRQIHSSSVFFVCPNETPEGHSAGIVKNFAIMTRVSNKIDTVLVKKVLETCRTIDTCLNYAFTGYKVFLNGILYGFASDPIACVEEIRRKREYGSLHHSISISWNDMFSEIHVYSDDGRMLRPLFHGRLFREEAGETGWDEWVKKQWIVYADSHEIENMYIAMYPKDMAKNPKFTHCEIHPCLMLGVCASNMPFPDHTQSPRICYQSSMGKQALSVYATTNPIRTDTIAYMMSYTERPLVRTHVSDYINSNELGAGNNLIVAIACYTGFNQEDSVIFNKSSIDRGVFRCYSYRTYMIEEKKKGTNIMENIQLPPEHIRVSTYNYTKLKEDGIVKNGSYVGPGDVIVGRVSTKYKNNKEETTDVSVVVKIGEEGYVDRIFITTSPDGYKIVKVKIRTQKVPEIGDKVASKCAQKGTIGMVFRQEDMPFTSSGIIPDLIVNPHAIPSRMTINQLLECLAGKVAVEKGEFRYATPFSSHSTGVMETLCEELGSLGFEKHGNERMFNGFSGEMLDASIFIGPTYYQRLKHLVSLKIHARDHGNVHTLTRQPMEGRSKDGGLRFGEMERDCFSGSTSISLKCGLAIELQTIKNGNWEVLGLDPETQGVMSDRQIGFLNKGNKDCVRITLEDGRSLVCTPDHQMLTYDGCWVNAQHLVPGVSRLKCSVNYPLVQLDDEILECNDWKLDVGDICLRTHTMTDILRTFAFIRVLGLLVTDGTISKDQRGNYTGSLTVGHDIDVSTVLDDLSWFCQLKPRDYYIEDRVYACYKIPIPNNLLSTFITIPGILIGKRIEQASTLPEFILNDNCPRPVVREFLAAMFGGDGHTCVLGMHRGKRDILTSISFAKTRITSHTESLVQMMQDMRRLLHKCGIHNVTIQQLKETTISKKKQKEDPSKYHQSFQSTLHLDISEVIPFHDKIGFRHCSHKTVRLEAAVAYRRLRENVIRQHNWLVKRVDEITHFSEIKKSNPTKIVGTKKALLQAIDELKTIEPLIHNYAIPTTHDITDHLIKGTQFGKFTSKSFPTAETFLKHIGAYSWFISDDPFKIAYGTCRSRPYIPTMELTVLDVRPCGMETVYDIEVQNTHSFLANGVVAHNCMISHGVSKFLKERLFDMSDRFEMFVCNDCGGVPHSEEQCNMCEGQDIRKVYIPYACKLLFQELNAMCIKTSLFS
jgi:DNA-directed RNA polymerase II subunit RPB2